MIERDILLRILKQIVRVLARMLELRDAGKVEEGLEMAADTYRDVFGLDPLYVDVMDSERLADMLGEAGEIRALAQVVTLESELLEMSGSAFQAAMKRRRALELCLEAHARRDPDEGPDAGLEDGVRGLLAQLDRGELTERHQRILEGWAEVA